MAKSTKKAGVKKRAAKKKSGGKTITIRVSGIKRESARTLKLIERVLKSPEGLPKSIIAMLEQDRDVLTEVGTLACPQGMAFRIKQPK